MQRLFCSVLFALISLQFLPAHASHYLGGELTYSALGNNQYTIIATVYADCLNGEQAAIDQDLPILASIYTGDGNTLVQTVELMASSVSLLQPPSPVGCARISGQFCVRYQRASATVTLPPSTTGYIIVNARCCLAGRVANVVRAAEQGIGMRAVIPPTTIANSSPTFRSLPPLMICAGQPFSLDLAAVDPDGDTVRHRLAETRNGGSMADPKPNPVPLAFSFVPLANGATPTAPFGPANPVTLDPVTGRLSGTVYTQGQYLFTVRADEYRQGSGLGAVERSYVIHVLPCPKSTEASIVRDEAAVAAGVSGVSIVRCGGQRTVSFQNSSVGAQRYFWDFGDGSTAADTSSATSPTYTYSAAGTYSLTLVAYGAGCNDTLRTDVILSDDVAPPVGIVAGLERPCAGNPVSFTSTNTDPTLPALSFIWQFREPASGLPPTSAYGTPVQYTTNLPGALQVTHTVRSAGGCLATVTGEYDIRGGEVEVKGDTLAPVGSVLFLNASGGASYQWIAMPPAELITSILPSSARQQVNTSRADTGLRFVCISTGINGCRDVDTVRVTVTERGYVFVPNAFSPNGDGLNDMLRPKLSGATLTEFVVYNRWGRQIFRTTDPQVGWDGTFGGEPQSGATFFWMVRAVPGDGPANATVVDSGDVTLVR